MFNTLLMCCVQPVVRIYDIPNSTFESDEDDESDSDEEDDDSEDEEPGNAHYLPPLCRGYCDAQLLYIFTMYLVIRCMNLIFYFMFCFREIMKAQG